MENEFIHNNPRDAREEIFARLEEKVFYISCKLLIYLFNKFGPFWEVGISNS
jgi:hypothetical protein